MIIDDDVYLEHFGKKGMRWGVRKVNKAHLALLSGNHALTGFGIRGAAATKIDNKNKKKGTAIDYKTYLKLPEKERKKYDRHIKRNAYGSVLLKNGAEFAGVTALSVVAIKKLPFDTKTKKGAEAAAIFLSANTGRLLVSNLNSIHSSYKIEKLRNKVYTPDGKLRVD